MDSSDKWSLAIEIFNDTAGPAGGHSSDEPVLSLGEFINALMALEISGEVDKAWLYGRAE